MVAKAGSVKLLRTVKKVTAVKFKTKAGKTVVFRAIRTSARRGAKMSISTIRIRATRRAPLWNPRARRAREIRANLFRVLGAVAAMIPSSSDADGCAAGVLTVAEIAECTRLSRSKVRAALTHFQTWRVLWVKYRAGEVEIRFQRQVAVGLIAAQRVCPLEVKRFMQAHRAKRECIVPYRKV